jgi:hypothetical protein
MATDKSEPRTGLIFTIGFLAIIILLTLRGALVSYFTDMTSAEEVRKFGHIVPEALISLRADEKQRLSAGPLPVDKAMQEMVAHGRMSASPDIMPSASKDLAPLQGWMKMPDEVPAAMTAPPMAPPIVDAGAPAPAAGADGGAHKPTGGTPKKPTKKQP